MKILVYIGIVIIVAALCYCSLVPGWLRPQSKLSGNLEHALAYFVAAVVIVITIKDPFQALFLLFILAALLETGQKWIPGRTAAFSHFLYSCSGIIAGGIVMKSVLVMV
ncbi:hypothetical protein [Jiella sp. M17.18]|uniref:hypothetical protein n=1 Tax=Jiella sp. M17.18 TaxID=3234247 RepID=UPI0034E007C1